MTKRLRQLDEDEIFHLNALDDINNFPVDYQRPEVNKKCSVEPYSAGGNGLMAKGFIEAGEVIIKLNGEKFNHALKYTIQTNHNTHSLGLGAINHKCADPNCYYDSSNNVLVAGRDIEQGEYLEFNYLTTEWDMAQGFKCTCGMPECHGTIQGFGYLSIEQRQSLIETLPVSEYLISRVNDAILKD